MNEIDPHDTFGCEAGSSGRLHHAARVETSLACGGHRLNALPHAAVPTWECRVAAIAADCKSAAYGHRGFESHRSHHVSRVAPVT